MDQIRYDIDLFMELNEEYAQNSAVLAHTAFLQEVEGDRLEAAAKGVVQVNEDLSFERGMRVLEIGCGRGHLSAILRRDYGCEVVGLDIRRYPEWDEFLTKGLDLRVHDISRTNNDALGTFDRIVALEVWEHLEHPYAALTAVKELLSDGGESLAYISANLYRGPKASHRYRHVFFPWPHLLFEDDVFLQFFQKQGTRRRSAWVNKLTAAHYDLYVRQLDFEVVREWTAKTPIDEAFYERFIDKLGRYPRYDLEQDFIFLVLGRQSRQQSDVYLRRRASSLEEHIRDREAAFQRETQRAAALEAEARMLRRRIRETRGSVSFQTGNALVNAARNPLRAWKLPAQVWRIWRDRAAAPRREA